MLLPDGVLSLWSDEPPEPVFVEMLRGGRSSTPTPTWSPSPTR